AASEVVIERAARIVNLGSELRYAMFGDGHHRLGGGVFVVVQRLVVEFVRPEKGAEHEQPNDEELPGQRVGKRAQPYTEATAGLREVIVAAAEKAGGRSEHERGGECNDERPDAALMK